MLLVLLLLPLVEEDIGWDSIEGVAGSKTVDEGIEVGAGAERVEDVAKRLVYEDDGEVSENKVEVDGSIVVKVAPGAAENDVILSRKAVDDADAVVVASASALLVVDGGARGCGLYRVSIRDICTGRKKGVEVLVAFVVGETIFWVI